MLTKKFFTNFFAIDTHTVLCPHCIHSVSISPPTTSWRVPLVVGEMKFGDMFITVQSTGHWQFFSSKNLSYTVSLQHFDYCHLSRKNWIDMLKMSSHHNFILA